MPKKRRKRKSATRPADMDHVLYVAEYEITDEPIYDTQYTRLPKPVKDAVSRLHEFAQTNPHEAIPELIQWIEQYPHIPMLFNYLCLAYSRAGDPENAGKVAIENYRRNPKYLFARVNYAEICLEHHDYDKIPEIFDHKYDLQMLYPHRKKFHVSEVAGFMGVIGAYFVETGQRDSAQKIYDVLRQVAPDHPFTRRLRGRLYPSFFARLIHRLTHPDKK